MSRMSRERNAAADMTASKPLLSLERVSKRFGESYALRNVDLSVDAGEKVCLIGPSGAGKSTLLRCCNLLEQPTDGAVFFGGRCVGRWENDRTIDILDSSELSRHRAKLAMVFQLFELFPHLSVIENICLGPVRSLGVPVDKARATAMALLDRVGLASFADARPRTLSGGQQQRVAIARGLAMEPELMLFDEPTSSLDPEMVGEVLALIRDVAASGMTVIIATHEMAFAAEIADRIVVMENGTILEEGPPTEVFRHPKKERTRAFLNAILPGHGIVGRVSAEADAMDEDIPSGGAK